MTNLTNANRLKNLTPDQLKRVDAVIHKAVTGRTAYIEHKGAAGTYLWTVNEAAAPESAPRIG